MHTSFGTVPFRFGDFIAKHRGHRAIAVKKALLSERPTPGQSSFNSLAERAFAKFLMIGLATRFSPRWRRHAMFAVDVSELQSKVRIDLCA
jgi:hypothetical protein